MAAIRARMFIGPKHCRHAEMEHEGEDRRWQPEPGGKPEGKTQQEGDVHM